MANIKYEIISPNLKFCYEDDVFTSIQYKSDDFISEEDKAELINPITEWNPFEDMIFVSKEEATVVLLKFGESLHAKITENRYTKDSYERISGHYKFIDGDFDFTAHVLGDDRHGYFIDITRIDTPIPNTVPKRKGILINGNTDGYYSCFGSSSIIRVADDGSWKFIDNFQQMEFSSYENAAKVICFLVGRSTSKLKNDYYIFNGYHDRVINVNECTNLYTGAFDNLCKYTPYTITGIFIVEIDNIFRVYPVCESRYPIANAIIPESYTMIDPVTKIVTDKWHNIYRIKDTFSDGVNVGYEVSNQLYSEEISITQFPYSSINAFRKAVKEFFGNEYDVLECGHSIVNPETEEEFENMDNRIWTITNYNKNIVWNYMVLTECLHLEDHTIAIYRPKYIDSRNNAIFV